MGDISCAGSRSCIEPHEPLVYAECMNINQFYQQLATFDCFSQLTDDRHYCQVPSEWSVIITDVKGSTEAIEAGRYKEVNRIGAAAIVCANHVISDIDLPYVFGGDGATFLVDPEHLSAVLAALASLKTLSEEKFGLSLRVGHVPVAELEAVGSGIELARFELKAGLCLCLFKGGGLQEAEKRIKSDEAHYCITASKETKPPPLGELSCRWNPVPAQGGVALSVLIEARGEHSTDCYQQLVVFFEDVLGPGLEAANPIEKGPLSYRNWWACFKDEYRQCPSLFSINVFKLVAQLTIAVLTLKWGWRPSFFDPVTYANSIAAHSDYRKFDDALRMIVDCTPEQADLIEAHLQALHEKKLIFYGLHRSKQSLMTCYVQDTQPGNHIHFVDGGDGGYAMAARQLKQQIKASAENQLHPNAN